MGTVHAPTAAARHNTSLREGGGLGRSPKTEGASGCIASLTGKAIKYHLQSKPELHRPLAPSVTCGDSSLPEGAILPPTLSLLRTHIIPLSKYQPSIYGLRRVAADYFARESSANRYCPSSARYRYRAKWGAKTWALCTH